MGKKSSAYAPEFRQRMIELVAAGRTPEELAREFEPSAQAIRNWVPIASHRIPRSGQISAIPGADGVAPPFCASHHVRSTPMPRLVAVYTMKPEDLAAFCAHPKSEQKAIDKAEWESGANAMQPRSSRPTSWWAVAAEIISHAGRRPIQADIRLYVPPDVGSLFSTDPAAGSDFSRKRTFFGHDLCLLKTLQKRPQKSPQNIS